MNWMRCQVPPIERGDRLGQRRLADAGDVLDEEVALGEQADEREVHLVALALDDALDVGEERVEQGPNDGGAAGAVARELHLRWAYRIASGRARPAARRWCDLRRDAPCARRSARGSGRRAAVLVLRRPRCGRPRSRQAGRLARPGGGGARRSSPFPTATTCGSGSRPSTATRRRPSPRDLVTYLEWCRAEAAPNAPRVRSRRGRLPTPRPAEEVSNAWEERCCSTPASSRSASCSIAPGGRARAEGEGRDRRAQRRRAPLRAARPAGAVGDPARPLRAGAVPEPGAALAPGRLRPRRPPLPVLQPRGGEHRPRRAPVARRPARVGERRRVVPVLQRPQGGPPPRRERPEPPPPPPRRPTPTSGSSPPPARSTPPGSPTSPTARRHPRVARRACGDQLRCGRSAVSRGGTPKRVRTSSSGSGASSRWSITEKSSVHAGRAHRVGDERGRAVASEDALLADERLGLREAELVRSHAREQEDPVVVGVGHPEDHRRERRLLLPGRAVARDDVVHVVGHEERGDEGVDTGQRSPCRR